MGTNLSKDHIRTLTELSECFSDMEYVLIGATAIKLQISEFFRQTEDVDLLVWITSEELPDLETILSGWTHNEKEEHRWLSPFGVTTDIIPICPDLMDGNFLVWPKSGNRMNMTGHRLAYDHALQINVTDTIEIPVAPVHIIALLKIIAYMDDPYKREKDLDDIVFMLTNYISEFDDRKFAPAIMDNNITFEMATAFTLGMDLGSIIGDDEKEILSAFINRVEGNDDKHQLQARLTRAGKSWRLSYESTFDLFESFSKGLTLTSGKS